MAAQLKTFSKGFVFVSFWLGLLTGAVILLAVFMFQSSQSTNFESAIIKQWVKNTFGVEPSSIFVQPFAEYGSGIFVQPVTSGSSIFVQPIESTTTQDIFVQP